MPIVAADLQAFQSANMPEADSTTSGGAIATAGKIEITDIAATDNVEVLSDGADTRTINIYGRNAAGAIINEAIVLNGTTPVTSANQYERILKVTITSDGTRTATVRRATGDTLICTLEPNITSQRRLFYDSTSESGITIRYEKAFYKNAHGTLTLTSATVKLTSDPAARYRIGGAPSVDDTATATNRKTAPASVTFVDDNVAQSVPTGQLTAGQAIGVWHEQNLPANDPAHKNSVTVELAGSTT
jgi:hypothetical protein